MNPMEATGVARKNHGAAVVSNQSKRAVDCQELLMDWRRLDYRERER